MLFWCLLYVGIILLIGSALTNLFLRGQRRSIPELLGLAMLLGTGATGTLLLWMSMLGFRPTRLGLIALAVISILVLLGPLARGQYVIPSIPRWDKQWPARIGVVALVLILLAANLTVWVTALAYEIFEWDSFCIWGLKAKVLYSSAMIPRPDYFNDLRLNYSHLDYPLLAPMLTAGSYAMMGQVDDRLGKIVLPIILAGQTCLAYTAARLWLGRVGALLATIVLICSPMNLQFAGLGVADVTLAAFWMGGAFYLVRWVNSRLLSDAILAAIFGVFTSLTKAEGLPLVFLLAVLAWIIAWRGRIWRHAIWITAIAGIGTGIWVLWRAGVPHTDENYLGQLRWSILTQNLHRLGTVLESLFGAWLDLKRWGGIWCLCGLMAILAFRAFLRPQVWVLWAMLVLHMTLYVAVFVISPWEDLNALLRAALGRVLLHVAPVAMMVIAAHWASIEEDPADLTPGSGRAELESI